ncbi:MAG: hypothetical protein K5984_00980, partial [Bacteroidales bacterium]|nr:hypothetical protein [Bacteroidales bacterium]
MSFSQEEDRNVMLNASSANKPRDISTGLPGEDAGAAILEDGAPLTVGLWPAYPYLHWAGGNSYSQIGLMSIESTALKTGIVNFGLDSHTWNVSEKLSGKVSAATSSFGLVKVDGAVVSPAGKNGWVNFGIYVNMDPTSTGEKSRSFVNNMRVYKIGFTKRFDEGTLSLQYKLTGDNSGVYGYSSAPFIYVGDGSIRELNGFRIGRDSYFPENDRIDFMDVQTGSMRSKSVKDMNRKHIHDAVLSWDGSAFGEWDLNASLHFSGTAGMNLAGIYSTGIDSASEGNLVQNRLGLLVEADYADVIADVTVSRRLGMHNVEAGLADWYGYMKCAGSSFFFAHTVEADPERVLNGGRSSWGYNQNAQYYYGNQNLVMLHAKDKFFVNSRFQLDYGFMTQLLWYDVKATVNPKGETCNLRREGFWIGDGLVRLQNISKVRLNYAALAGFNYDLGQGVFLAGEYLLSSKAKTVNDYGFADMPVNKPTVKHLARLGLQFEKRTGDLSLNASSMATWIASRNNSSILYLTKQISGVSETLSYTGIYGIDTFGWTSEAS